MPRKLQPDSTGLLLLLAASRTSAGVANPAWYAMIAKVIPVERRGLWSGLARSLGALLGVAGGVASGWLLTHWAFPQNYGYLFLLAFLFVAISWLGLAANREPPSPTVKPRSSLGAYLGRLPAVLRRDGDADPRVCIDAEALNRCATIDDLIGLVRARCLS